MNGQAIKILLIDDDEDDYVITRKMIAKIEGGGFDLEWNSSYAAAVETIKACRHDIYLIDYRLGEHDGVDLVRLVLASGCKAPVIMLTGQGERRVDIEATKGGCGRLSGQRVHHIRRVGTVLSSRDNRLQSWVLSTGFARPRDHWTLRNGKTSPLRRGLI